MEQLPIAWLGALLIVFSAPPLLWALATKKLLVGIFPSPETFAPALIRRDDNPRAYRWHLVGECTCLAAGVVFLFL